MKKNTIIIVVVLLVIVLGGGVLISRAHKKTDSTNTSDTSASTPAVAADPHTVIMKDLAFTTNQTITVKKGTTVTWKNEDTASHTVSFDDSANSAMDGPLTAPGKTYQHKFDVAGTYAYHCMPHPFMKGTVVVTD